MDRRTFLETASVAATAAVATTGVAAAATDRSRSLDDVEDCSCEGTYEACCGPDGPCDC